MHRTIVHYNKPLLRQAVRGFWWRVLGWRFLVALVLVAAGLIASVRDGDSTWFIAVLGAPLVFGLAFALALYAVHYRRALQKLHAMGSPQATLDASESGLSMSSGMGTASLPWSSVSEIWQFKTCWLLVLSKSQFLTLPIAGLPPEFAEFVVASVRASGGKVS